ncbi:uncharacterized protein METZ01_LOCUS296645, partial [marine metagenome]
MLTNAVFEFVVSVRSKLRERCFPDVSAVGSGTVKIINSILMSAFLI